MMIREYGFSPLDAIVVDQVFLQKGSREQVIQKKSTLRGSRCVDNTRPLLPVHGRMGRS
jgi:hypothetical protein